MKVTHSETKSLLTGDLIGLVESFCNFWVHINQQVMFTDVLLVSGLDVVVDPVFERLS